MNPQQLESAHALLWDAWQNGRKCAALPDSCMPRTRADGYAIQALLEKQSNGPISGWKIAATSIAGQQHIGVSGPLAGRILPQTIVANGGQIALANNALGVAECEFAFTMARDLAPRPTPWSRDEVLSAVKSFHPAIELPDSRFAACHTVGEAQLIADNACAHAVVIGPATSSNWRTINLANHAVTGSIENTQGVHHHHGVGSNVLGDPREALTWLANELRQIDVPLKAGQVVITGTCVTPIPVNPGDRLRANFGALGEVSAVFV